MEFLKTYTPDIDQVSVDECFLDFTGISYLYSSPVEAAFAMKDAIYKKFGSHSECWNFCESSSCKHGVHDFEKPNKVHTLFPEEIPRMKMWQLPISDLYMAENPAKRAP